MEMKNEATRRFYFAFLISIVAVFSSCQGSYVVMVPQYFRAGASLHVAVTINTFSTQMETYTVIGSLAGKSSSTTPYTVSSGSVRMISGQSKLLTIKVPFDIDPEVNVYRLKVQGKSPTDSFKEEVSIRLNKNSSLLMVQTDKNIYKPGQKVLFRVLHLTSELAPVNDPLVAVVVNEEGNKLDRFDDLTSSNGVVEREFKLSPDASLGEWSIQLYNFNDDFLYKTVFTVEEYVLPKFAIEVTPDPDFLVWGVYNQPPAVIVKAMYTFGKAVLGECTLTIGRLGRAQQTLSQKIPEDGVIEFVDINWANLIGTQPISLPKKLRALVEVEDVTGRKETAEAFFNVFRGDYVIDILPATPEILHSGIETEFYVQVLDHRGQPISGQPMDVIVNMPGSSTLRTVVSLKEGQVYATFKATLEWGLKKPSTDIYNMESVKGSLQVQLSSDKLVQATKYLFWYVSKSGEHVKIQAPLSLAFKKGQPQDLSIVTTSSATDGSLIGYIVVSKGDIVETGIVTGNTLTLTPTMAMCPMARLLVYLILPAQVREAAELVADVMDIPISMCTDSKVQVTFEAKQQRTGTDAMMQINILKQSDSSPVQGIHDVFFMAVDKSVSLLQGDTVLDNQRVLNAMNGMNLWSNQEQYCAQQMFQSMKLIALSSTKLCVTVNKHEIQFKMMEDAAFEAVARSSSNDEESFPAGSSNPEKMKENGPEAKIRKNFPETWLWGQEKTLQNGQLRTQVRLPDTITSWRVSAFAINADSMAVSATPFELIAFRPFFVSLNLPYSIKKGEVFSLVITVFNYRLQEVNTAVRLKNDNDFVISEGTAKDGWNEFLVTIAAKTASSVVYEINATSIGRIKLNVLAEDVDDTFQRDEVIRDLLVKSPGEERTEVITEVMVLVDRPSITKTFNIQWPTENIYEGSQKVQLKVTGEIMGQTLSNLDLLVRQPTGCGEQNMIGLVPNIYGVMYITLTDQKNVETFVEKMITNMKNGYQRQVDKYQHSDGSYSAWKSDPKGSTWLTAFVLKSFVAASKHIHVDSNVIASATAFIKSKQNSDGTFREDGRVLHKELLRGTGDGIALSVYCLMSILEMGSTKDVKTSRTVSTIISKIDSIIKSSEGNVFLPALTVYTLSLIKNAYPVSDDISKLIEYIENAGVPWEIDVDMPGSSSPLTGVPTARSQILMSGAYTLLAYLKLNNAMKAMKVMKWLQAKQNKYGGYDSTQDTVVILQSLAEFGVYFKNLQETGQIEISVPEWETKEILDISGKRSILLQIVDLPSDTNQVDVMLTGDTNTLAIVKLVYSYNTPADDSDQRMENSEKSALDLNTKSRSLSKTHHQIEACIKSSLDSASGMYVISFNLPSGEIPSDSINKLMKQNILVKRVEVEDDVVHFYIDEIPSEGSCVTMTLEKQTDFSVQMPGSVNFYSYYEPEYYKESSIDLLKSLDCTKMSCVDDNSSGVSISSFISALVICFIASLLTRL